MKYRITLEQSFENCTLQTRDYGDEKLHQITATGAIGRSQRAAVFKEVLKGNQSENFFYILDNRGGFEIELSFADMTFLNGLLYDGGIRYIRGSVITLDVAYNILVSMAKAKARAENFEVELISTPTFAEGEEFVTSKLLELLKVKQN